MVDLKEFRAIWEVDRVADFPYPVAEDVTEEELEVSKRLMGEIDERMKRRRKEAFRGTEGLPLAW